MLTTMKIEAVDSCGKVDIYSDVSEHYLSMNSSQERVYNLKWNFYEGWKDGVEKYESFTNR